MYAATQLHTIVLTLYGSFTILPHLTSLRHVYRAYTRALRRYACCLCPSFSHGRQLAFSVLGAVTDNLTLSHIYTSERAMVYVCSTYGVTCSAEWSGGTEFSMERGV